MRFTKVKIFMFAIFAMFLLFFSNDFGLIDIEKTAIITALAIDIESESEETVYNITAQIAVPEATDTNTESVKAQISGKGATIGSAIKNIGDVSGWFPKLSFCNLIILGSSFDGTCVIRALDYFSKTLRVQDSALVIYAENTAKELLESSTPLDGISSFALQKILFKNDGFDSDIARIDVKEFCVDYYNVTHSSTMPLVKIIKGLSSGGASGGGSSSSGSESSGGSGGSEDKPVVFDARTTALFLDGVKVGELTEMQTLTRNALFQNFNNTTFEVKNVKVRGEDEDEHNYLLTVLKCSPKLELSASENELKFDISLDMYCKISDQNAKTSDLTYSNNTELPEEVRLKAEEIFTENINSLITAEKTTGCDFLKIKQQLYRFHYKYYNRYKDNYLDMVKTNVKVNVSGQK